MKKQIKKQNDSKTEKPDGLTTTPVTATSQIKERLLKKLKSKKDDSTDVTGRFLLVAARVLATNASFDYQTFIQIAKAFDWGSFSTFTELRRLYDIFTTELTFAGVLEQQDSIYAQDDFIFLQITSVRLV
jgi:hypothetical protein